MGERAGAARRPGRWREGTEPSRSGRRSAGRAGPGCSRRPLRGAGGAGGTRCCAPASLSETPPASLCPVAQGRAGQVARPPQGLQGAGRGTGHSGEEPAARRQPEPLAAAAPGSGAERCGSGSGSGVLTTAERQQEAAAELTQPLSVLGARCRASSSPSRPSRPPSSPSPSPCRFLSHLLALCCGRGNSDMSLLLQQVPIWLGVPCCCVCGIAPESPSRVTWLPRLKGHGLPIRMLRSSISFACFHGPGSWGNYCVPTSGQLVSELHY